VRKKSPAKIVYKGRYPKNDLVGLRFERLLVLSFEGRDRGTRAYWRCLCDCGEEKVVAGSSLTDRCSKSCGCLRREMANVKNTSHEPLHGMWGEGVYVSWACMKCRCNWEGSSNYHLYGGRGIKVCERWEEFRNFYEDMGDRPEGMTIDRIDSDGDYEPSNCSHGQVRSEHGDHLKLVHTILADPSHSIYCY